MTGIYFDIKLFLNTRFVHSFVWVINNFLRMECYRKLCNKLYWKKLEPGTIPYTTRIWMITITALSAIWLAFYFNPTDPTNSNSSSGVIKLLSNLFKKLNTILHSFFNITEKINYKLNNLLSLLVLDSENIFLWRSKKTYLRTSAILI